MQIINSILPVITMMIGFYFGYKLRGMTKFDNMPKIELKSPKKIIEERKEKIETEEYIKDVEKWVKEIDDYSGEFGK